MLICLALWLSTEIFSVLFLIKKGRLQKRVVGWWGGGVNHLRFIPKPEPSSGLLSHISKITSLMDVVLPFSLMALLIILFIQVFGGRLIRGRNERQEERNRSRDVSIRIRMRKLLFILEEIA